MKHKGTKRFITLVLILALVFTMTVPASAASWDFGSKKSVSYLAIGDSVGAGFKGTLAFDKESVPINQYWYDKKYFDQFIDYNTFDQSDEEVEIEYNSGGINQKAKIDQYEKKGKEGINAVEFTYVSRLADLLGADEDTSFNGTFNGMRAKDICHMVGIEPVEEGDYDAENDGYTAFMDQTYGNVGVRIPQAGRTMGEWYNFPTWEYMFYGCPTEPVSKDVPLDKITNVNSRNYIKAIREADVITVELGSNDLSALTFSEEFNELAGLITGNGSSFLGEFGALQGTQGSVNAEFGLADLIGGSSLSASTIQSLFETIADAKDKLIVLVKQFLTQNQYYFTKMMEYIDENKKDGATVVVGTLINPFKYSSALESLNEYLNTGFVSSNSSDPDVISEIFNVFIDGMNVLIKAEALKYHYSVADLSDVNLCPPAERAKDENDEKYGYTYGGEDAYVLKTEVSNILWGLGNVDSITDGKIKAVLEKYPLPENIWEKIWDDEFWRPVFQHMMGTFWGDAKLPWDVNSMYETEYKDLYTYYENGKTYYDGEIVYMMHPNDEGQQQIADAFFEKIALNKLLSDPTVQKVAIATAAVAGTVAVGNVVVDLVKDARAKKDSKAETTTPVTEELSNLTKEVVDTQKQETTDTTPVAEELTAEEVTEMIANATVGCKTEKTSKGIKVTAKVEDLDLDTLKEDGYTVAYKFYRSTKKSSGYKNIFTSKTGKFTNTSVKKGNKYYYKTVLVVTDSEGNEVTKSVLKDCKYGARTF